MHRQGKVYFTYLLTPAALPAHPSATSRTLLDNMQHRNPKGPMKHPMRSHTGPLASKEVFRPSLHHATATEIGMERYFYLKHTCR
jgi:hypothetical protein